MNSQIKKFTKDDFKEIWEIMQDAFPRGERREEERQRALLEKEEYCVYGILKDGTVAAFLAVWEFLEFRFVEHFAVAKEYRNSGIGTVILQEVLAQSRKRVILEVELPKEELKRRRIAFYERNGFTLNTYPYVQPELSPNAGELPLYLMSTQGQLTDMEFAQIKNTLYEQVYGCRQIAAEKIKKMCEMQKRKGK